MSTGTEQHSKTVVRFLYSENQVKRKIFSKHEKSELNEDYSSIAKFLVGKINGPPVVIDYGCGLGYISFEIGKLQRDSKVYLVDIDTLILEFAKFRFEKHGINVETIPVTKDNLYPKLPVHNICIATEVMEHVIQPLKVYQNIYDSLEQEGILYGNFEDHKKEMFHVSPHLGELRERIATDFQPIVNLCYKKKKSK
jgi:2-polyprenyl-3-methyl-5-hydroxy-6-metoxy-1,4-benzoquinol methylase